jgi:hypothetical protein
VVLPEDTDEPPDELEVEARLLVLFHRPRDEFRGFVEVRLVDAQVVTPCRCRTGCRWSPTWPRQPAWRFWGSRK